jgi:hypothetical protein
MPEYFFTTHAKDMLKEREITEQLVLQTIRNPDRRQSGNDGNIILRCCVSVRITFYM